MSGMTQSSDGSRIVPLRHGGTLNGRRAASPLMGLVEGEERWEDPGHPQGFLSLNWGGTEQNRTVTCMVLKATANDRRKNSSLPAMNFASLDRTLSGRWSSSQQHNFLLVLFRNAELVFRNAE
ncbi:uncharacterized protein TNCV_2419151 [Trichonephila clavipes]|nr:uncharacterized protein TNCV_2419151 [Trichonephila clavipes]